MTAYIDECQREWKPFVVEFQNCDGIFQFEVMAISHLHAEEILADIKLYATVKGELVHTVI